MNLSKNILILGGDLRQSTIYDILTEKEYNCKFINDSSSCDDINKKIPLYDVIILPVPVSHDGVYLYSENKKVKIKLETILSSLSKSQLLIGGCISEDLKTKLSEKNIEFFDFYKDKELVVYNAYLTSQGALRLLLENSNEYLNGKKMLITGYGAVAKATALIMKENGLDVYICVRSSFQKTQAQCQGYKTLSFDELESIIHIFDFVMNTVPAKIFTDEVLKTLSKKSKYFELASAPYAIDPKNFEENPIKFIKGNALPGRFLPVSAGEIIEKVIEPKLR